MLQNIEENALVKLLRTYGSLKAARHIASAILEARYMNYEFKTVHELTEIMETAVKHATKTPHSDMADPQLGEAICDSWKYAKVSKKKKQTFEPHEQMAKEIGLPACKR